MSMTSPASTASEPPNQRLRRAREQAGFARASDAARAMGVEEPTYLGHENGSRGLSRAAPRYARFFGVSLDWLIDGRAELAAAVSAVEPPHLLPPRNAELGGPARFGARIPAYGQAVGGRDGEFILNGNRIVDVLAP